MNIRYIIKKIWFLIVLLVVSAVIVLGGFTRVRLFPLFDAYFRFALYVIITGVAASLLPKVLPKEFNTDTGFFSAHDWEKKGKFYEQVFHVTKWKDQVMEAGKIFSKPSVKAEKADSTKTNLQLSRRNQEAVNQFLAQTCVSELVHWILILGSPSLLFIIKNRLRWLFWTLYVADNLMDIIIQRYNRPRLKRLAAATARQRTETGSN